MRTSDAGRDARKFSVLIAKNVRFNRLKSSGMSRYTGIFQNKRANFRSIPEWKLLFHLYKNSFPFCWVHVPLRKLFYPPMRFPKKKKAPQFGEFTALEWPHFQLGFHPQIWMLHRTSIALKITWKGQILSWAFLLAQASWGMVWANIYVKLDVKTVK